MPKPKGSGHERTSERTGTWAPLFKSLRPPSGPGRSARCTQRVHRPGVGQRPAQVLRVPLFGPCSPAPGCCPGSGSFGTLREPPRSRGASTCSTDVRRGQAAALLAGALPERPRRRGRGRAGPARGPLGFVVQTLWPPAAPPGRDWRQPLALSRKGKLMPSERTQLAQDNAAERWLFSLPNKCRSHFSQTFQRVL